VKSKKEGRRKKEEGRRKKEEGRRKKVNKFFAFFFFDYLVSLKVRQSVVPQ